MSADDQRHEAVGRAIRSAAESVHAPPSLRTFVAEQTRHGRASRRTRRLRLAAAGAFAAALAFAVVLTSGASPTVQDVAASALQPPTREAPARIAGEFIDARIDGIQFPDWKKRWGWNAIGSRTDTVDGREALTVIYTRGKRGVHYTVVEGAPLDAPEGARTIESKGVKASIVRDGDATTVSWERDGHTCLLSSTLVGADDLLKFIHWD